MTTISHTTWFRLFPYVEAVAVRRLSSRPHACMHGRKSAKPKPKNTVLHRMWMLLLLVLLWCRCARFQKTPHIINRKKSWAEEDDALLHVRRTLFCLLRFKSETSVKCQGNRKSSFLMGVPFHSITAAASLSTWCGRHVCPSAPAAAADFALGPKFWQVSSCVYGRRGTANHIILTVVSLTPTAAATTRNTAKILHVLQSWRTFSLPWPRVQRVLQYLVCRWKHFTIIIIIPKTPRYHHTWRKTTAKS